MDYSGFLRYLNDHIDHSETSGRMIICFPHPAQYAECVRRLAKLKRTLPALRKIRASFLLNALICPLAVTGGGLLERMSLLTEKDMKISVHSPAPAGKERSPDTLWGIQRIGASDTWSVTTGYRIRIGVIDTGADYGHPDLHHSLARGINLLNRISPPYDDNGHGTHIAGTIAASGGSKGMMGVAPRSLIYPVKAFDHNGSAYVSDIILGIDWCVRNRMHIVNMSFGMKNKSQSLQNIIRKAYNAGIIVVASSGNDKRSRGVDYPARYAQTISVGATNKESRIASFSNRGSHIDIYAPGEKITSCWIGGGYKEMSGTSMATSHVSGSIALLLALQPGLKPDEIKRRLRRTARPLALSSRSKVGAGEVSAVRLIRAAKQKEGK